LDKSKELFFFLIANGQISQKVAAAKSQLQILNWGCFHFQNPFFLTCRKFHLLYNDIKNDPFGAHMHLEWRNVLKMHVLTMSYIFATNGRMPLLQGDFIGVCMGWFQGKVNSHGPMDMASN
jgi:hypothetical protein